MRPWSDFYDLVVPHVPGCPFQAIDAALRQSAIRFCEQAQAWQVPHDDITVSSGTAGYDFAPPAGAVVHTIIHSTFNGEEINCKTKGADIELPDWRDEVGTPEYVLGGNTSLTLVPEPDVDGTLSLIVALKPAPDAAGVEDFIFNEYREAIMHGALAWLMISPKKPYTDMQLALFHRQQFTILAGGAGIRVARSNTRAPLRTAILKRG